MSTKNNTSKNAIGEPVSKEWDNLHLEQMQLNIKQMKLDIEIRESDIKHKQLQNTCDKIEQARRNVEVLSKLLFTYSDKFMGEGAYKAITTILNQNISVLSEVSNIK
jgi:ketopantoate reductase